MSLELESFSVTDKNLIICAMFDDIVYVPRSQTMGDPPEFEPTLCEANISLAYSDLPNLDYASMTVKEVAEVVNNCIAIEDLFWTVCKD